VCDSLEQVDVGPHGCPEHSVCVELLLSRVLPLALACGQLDAGLGTKPVGELAVGACQGGGLLGGTLVGQGGLQGIQRGSFRGVYYLGPARLACSLY
jgi:hypothetical protein